MNDHMSDTTNEYQYQLDVHVRITGQQALFRSNDKVIHEATWIDQRGPSIVILQLNGSTAQQEALYYLRFSDHPHIIKTLGRVENDRNVIMLLQERSPKADLSEILRYEPQFKPTEEVFCTIFRQVCEAMIVLLSANVTHGDLACRNILVFQCDSTIREKNIVKLTDFGLSQQLDDNSSAQSSTSIVPIRYVAPELLESPNTSRHSEKTEMFSMGVSMWEACSHGEIPHGSIQTDDEIKQIKINGGRLRRPSICSNQMWTIIDSCLDIDPANRPSFQSLQKQLSDLTSQSKAQLRPRGSSGMTSISVSRYTPLPPIAPNNQNSSEVAVRTSRELRSGLSSNRRRLSEVTVSNERTDGFEGQNAVERKMENDQPSSFTNRPIPCQLCHESLPSKAALSEHFISCGNKTDRCPNCHRFVRRAIFNYHIEHDCADIEDEDNPPNRLPQLETPLLSRPSTRNTHANIPCTPPIRDGPVRTLDPIQTSVSNRVSSQYQNELNKRQEKGNQSHRFQKDRRLSSRKISVLDVPRTSINIPCDICGKQIEESNYSTHAKNCLERDQDRVGRRAQEINRQPITDLIPCEFCQRLYRRDQLSSHQANCQRNRQRLLPPIRHDNPQRRSTVLRASRDRTYRNTPSNTTDVEYEELRLLNTSRHTSYTDEDSDQDYSLNRSNFSRRSPRNNVDYSFIERTYPRNTSRWGINDQSVRRSRNEYRLENNQYDDYRPNQSRYIPANRRYNRDN